MADEHGLLMPVYNKLGIDTAFDVGSAKFK